ncbi:type VI secretion system contractile sheath small subunit [Sphaerotilus montanus]|uniref:Type VI secretion system protein ImpB n=1 Tax=Sphaerotilus montanus TaxID=522889 RepID=A0A7Y9U598_9BURK|nr:type VI secretion system contractile sheath small subunit [Sphaerotilus montanus]NYG31451.1 type VI secretion system protein ImpB [Sphaerotilus montanus]NZD55432.1 type VI secretion system contractile sheath small subunit [Sphaerotilus montanus]
MPKECTQHWLRRNRPPRVQITYDVETGGAMEKRELPLLVGVLADLSRRSTENRLLTLAGRHFVEIDRDNFDEVMAKVAPAVEVNKVTFTFSKIEQFTPVSAVLYADQPVVSTDASFDEKKAAEEVIHHAHLVNQDPVLRDFFTKRQLLRDLMIKLDGNESLDANFLQLLSESSQPGAS